MSKSAPAWTDEGVDRAIAALLRVGLSIATAVVMAGAVVYLGSHWNEMPVYRTFRGEPAELRSVHSIVRDVWQPDGAGLIQLGVLLLLLTPVARVLFSVVAFALRREFLYVTVTLVVAAILLYSIG
jgi:uncharacterized membrane protein